MDEGRGPLLGFPRLNMAMKSVVMDCDDGGDGGGVEEGVMCSTMDHET